MTPDNVFAARRQAREVGDGRQPPADFGVKTGRVLMWKRQEFLKVSELIHHLQRRGTDGVASEISQEIVMLLSHCDIDAGPCEQPAGPATTTMQFYFEHGVFFGIFRLEQCRYCQPGGRTVRDVPGRLAWRFQSGP